MAISTPANSQQQGSTVSNGSAVALAVRNNANFSGRFSPTTLSALDLKLGMTAGYATDGEPTSNPGFNPRIYGGNPAWAPRRVGVLASLPGSIGPGSPAYLLYFQFNPNEVVVNFQTNTQGIPPVYWSDTFSTQGQGNNPVVAANFNANGANNGVYGAVPAMTTGQTVSWSLVFDRTYELNFTPQAGYERGVLQDVAALYNMLGTFTSDGAIPFSTPVKVIFGVTDYGAIWGFTGFITQATITHGIFRRNMIPSRCEIDITLQAVYVGAAIPASYQQPSGIATGAKSFGGQPRSSFGHSSLKAA